MFVVDGEGLGCSVHRKGISVFLKPTSFIKYSIFLSIQVTGKLQPLVI
jgi:hypothetical protein